MAIAKQPAPALPASTLILIRDAPEALEVLMLERHHEVRFATSAVVFPGGKVEAGDRSTRLRALCVGADAFDDEALALRAAAIRETFEESGVLLARERGAALLLGPQHADTLQEARKALDTGACDFSELLEAHGWRLACDVLVRFAHWITPPVVPKRFDTHFFVASAPRQEALHDGSESVDSFWITPRVAMEDAAAERRNIMFPTLRNLEKLRRAANVEDALARAARDPIVTVLPRVVETERGRMLRIPEAAGYDVNEIPFVPPGRRSRDGPR